MSHRRPQGFTIVELLIVIVVIAILAAISVVAYTGIQQRAQNTKTVSVVTQWAKALQMYKADHGDYPAMASCLGSGYGRGFSGNESTGGECRQDTESGGSVIVSSSFMSAMAGYIASAPTPSFITAGSSTGYPWYRGAYYYVTTPRRIDVVLAGSGTPCPVLAGISPNNGPGIYVNTNSVFCRYSLPE